MIQRFFNTRFFEGPDVEINPRKQACFDELLAWARGQADVPEIPWDGSFAKHEFFWYAVERRGLLARGANRSDFTLMEPIEGQDYFEHPVKAVFASSDALWPMFFALVDRQHPRLRCFWGDALQASPDEGQPRKIYAYAINREAYDSNPYTEGCLYLLPPDSFQPVKSDLGRMTLECICETPVRPLAKMKISASDFPFLDIVQPFEYDDLTAMLALQRAARRKIDHPDGGTLWVTLEDIPIEKVMRAVEFIRLFYPGFQLTLEEPQTGEVAVTMRFPKGAVKFCKEEWLA